MDNQNVSTDESIATPSNDTPAPDTSTPEPSLRDSLTAAFKASAEGTTDENKPVERARDATGKFTKAETAAAEKAEAPKTQAPVESAQQSDAAKVETQAPVTTAPSLKAPAGWSAESKAAFDALPEFVKADIVRREENVDKGFAKYRGLDKHVQAFSEMGVDLAQAIDNYRAAEQLLEQNGSVGFARLMQQMGYDPIEIAKEWLGVQNTQQGGQQPSAAPLNPALLKELSDLKAEVATVRGQFNGERLSKAEAEAQAFLSDPAHVHAEAVIDDMVALINAAKSRNVQMSFKEAYEQAIWARPDIRSKLLDEQFKAREEKRTKELAEAAQKAKQAASSVTGSPLANGKSGGPSSNRTVREDLIAAMQEARARV